mgnify:CR=1 FL=1
MMGETSVIDDKSVTAYTDGVNKRYGRSFLQAVCKDQLEVNGLVLHENLHISLRQMLHNRDLFIENPKKANMAADFVVNSIIMNLKDKSLAKLPEGGCYDPRFDNMNMREVYRILKEEEEEGGGGEPEEGGDGNSVSGGDDYQFDEHDVDNNMTPEELRESLRGEGIEYHEFLEQIRGEITQQRLRASQVNSQIKISDREVDQWLEKRGTNATHPDTEFLLGHILISVPQTANTAAVDAAKSRAEKILAELRGGQDFKQVAMGSSDSSEALKGGDLGWRKLTAIPTLFAEIVPHMKKGDVEGPIRSPSGFHLIKLLDTRGSAVDRITKTHVRHILIKPNELITNQDARKKLEAIRDRIKGGDDFGDVLDALIDVDREGARYLI